MSRVNGFPEHDYTTMTISQVLTAWGQPRAEDAFDYADLETLIQGVGLIDTMKGLIERHGDINIVQALVQEFKGTYPRIRVEIGSKIPESME